MANRRPARIVAFGFLLAVVGVNGYFLWRPEPAAPIVGVVRTTEVRIAPEVGGQLEAIKVRKGDRVRAGDVVAELSALELTASVGQARAALAAATADRNNVYAGVRAEEIASLAAGIAKAKAKLDYAQAQLTRTTTLARTTPPRSRRSTRRRTTRRAHAPISQRRKPITLPQSPGRPKRSAPSPTRRSRQRRPRSQCWSGSSTRPSCGHRPTVSSP